MLDEVLEYLRPAPGMVFVDATVGAGGHARAILERIQPGGRLIALDRDPEALEVAARTLAQFGADVTLAHSRFDRLDRVLGDQGLDRVDGVLMDLGVSSLQLDRDYRGFSFSRSGPLDMRMDPSGGATAAEWIAGANEQELADLFYRYGEDRWARRIARRLIEARDRRPVVGTLELAEIVAGAVPRKAWPRGIHPATRVFQALRIAVNEELTQIEPTIRQAVAALQIGGRIAVIAFHSLEDRIVKGTFRSLGGECTCPPRLPVCSCGAVASVRPVTHGAVKPSEAEVDRNPRARSARLRVVERL